MACQMVCALQGTWMWRRGSGRQNSVLHAHQVLYGNPGWNEKRREHRQWPVGIRTNCRRKGGLQGLPRAPSRWKFHQGPNASWQQRRRGWANRSLGQDSSSATEEFKWAQDAEATSSRVEPYTVRCPQHSSGASEAQCSSLALYLQWRISKLGSCNIFKDGALKLIWM
jgi:hypothetical protein